MSIHNMAGIRNMFSLKVGEGQEVIPPFVFFEGGLHQRDPNLDLFVEMRTKAS